MKYFKIVGLLALAAAGLMAFTASASAATATSPLGTVYTSNVEATSTNVEIHGAFTTIKCSHSLIKFKIERHGLVGGITVDVGGKVTYQSFTGCNYEVTVKSGGSLGINSSNKVTSTGASTEIHTSVGTCVFTTNNTSIGTVTEGSNASIDTGSSKIPRTGGNFLCGSFGEWTGDFDLITPNNLWID
jgi:hypothetical protein